MKLLSGCLLRIALPRWFVHRSTSQCDVGARELALDHVVNRGDHRLAESDVQSRKDRHQRRAEGLELLVRLPDVKDLDLAVRLERKMIRATLGRSRTRRLESFDRFSVLLWREAAVHEIDSQCHLHIPPRSSTLKMLW